MESSRKIIVSSANWRWVIWFEELASLIPLKIPFLAAQLSMELRTLPTRLLSNGDNGSPCLRPRLDGNSLVGDPLISQEILVVPSIDLIQEHHLLLNFIASMVLRRNSQLTVSKAFLKSSLRMSPFALLFWMECTTSLTNKMLSEACLPLMNPDCESPIRLPICFANLVARILRRIFSVELMRLIGLKSLICSGF